MSIFKTSYNFEPIKNYATANCTQNKQKKVKKRTSNRELEYNPNPFVLSHYPLSLLQNSIN